MDLKNWTPEFWLKNENDCLNFLKANYNSVPLLNVIDIQYLSHKSLVKFRGMIQDMYNPEYYMEKYEVINEVTKDTFIKNGKYFDSADCKDNEVIDFESPNNVTGERHTFVAVSIPGLNTWVDVIETNEYKVSQNHSVKSRCHQTKRSLDADTDPHSTVVEMVEQQSACVKKQCVKSNSEMNTDSIVSQDHLLNFPLPGRAGKSCHLKVYQNADSIKLNDVFEFFGFLSVDTILTPSSCYNTDTDSEIEVQTHNPPTSLVPRIHCIHWRNLDHNNPLVTQLDMDVLKMQFLWKELYFVLTQLLLGDALAAQYLIYHLISGVYLRKDLMALGKFTLNISNIPASLLPDYCEKLYKFIERLIPKSHYLPMTLENMNDLAFIPKKDYNCNRLTSGVLQLSNNTHLVLDEIKLTPGKLNECGVKAISSLSNVIKCQKVTYDFRYYQMEFECDIPVLIISEGKSLLPTDCHIILKPDEVCVGTFNEIIEAADQYLKPELLNDIRAYLTVARLAKYEISDNVQELVQNDFVVLRSQNNVTADDLHNLLVLARLVCLSEGEAILSDECWRRTCELEFQRKERLKS